ncbi:MAG: preprotein translocase subunit SecG [Gammaproteobacteria bacterium]|nr:preprotein translocase subunit SecG [Gammaproteobacteria bacterium]
MDTLETVLLMLMVVDAIALGVLVLLQQGKGADIGAAFGSGSSNTVFGGAGAGSFLATVTTWLAVGFFLLSFALAYTAKERAAGLSDIGIPKVDPTTVQVPATPPSAGAAGVPELTAPVESVDSDIPSESTDSDPSESMDSDPSESMDSDIPKL